MRTAGSCIREWSKAARGLVRRGRPPPIGPAPGACGSEDGGQGRTAYDTEARSSQQPRRLGVVPSSGTGLRTIPLRVVLAAGEQGSTACRRGYGQ